MFNNNKIIINQFKKLIEQIKYEIDNPSVNLKKNNIIANRYRLKNFINAINIIKKMNKNIRSSKDLDNIKGIGEGIKNRIDEILKNGKLNEINIKNKDLEYSQYIDELEKIFGIGRKKAYKLVIKYNIKSIKDLKNAYNNGEIKLNEQILIGLKYYDVYKQNIPRKEIDDIYEYLKKKLIELDYKLNIIICGSYRRGKKTSNDIDVLITHKNIKTKFDLKTKHNYLYDYVNLLKQDKFLIDDLTFEKYESKYMGFSKYKKKPIRRIDIRYIPYESYYPAILYFTGSGEFNTKMRNTAKLLGYKLNEYGLYKINKNNIKKLIKVKSEKDIFNKLGMEYLEPNER